MTLGSIDYATSYFKYKTPTPIRGTPTNQTLKRLKTELRANASSVESDLGGGDHGYLGLVLTDVEYASITPTPPVFVPPPYPPALVILAGTDPVAALTIREQHKHEKREYYECKNVEKALQRHVQDAIEEKFLESLVNEDTQLIQADIPMVLEYLFETYGKIPSEEVKQQEAEIRSLTFQPADPMILLYNPIEKLGKMAIDAGIPYTANQLLDIGLTVIRNTRDFERALGDWELKPIGSKTWANFKTHFTSAQKQLKAIRGPTMQQAGYHHANSLAQQIRTDLTNRDTDIMSIITSAIEQASLAGQPPSLSGSSLSDMTHTTPTHQANAVTSDPVQLEILKLLQKIQQDNAANASPTTQTPAHHPQRSRRPPRKTPDNATFPRRKVDIYCWTHGGCAHTSVSCSQQAPGHQPGATFADRKGGSNAYCTTTP